MSKGQQSKQLVRETANDRFKGNFGSLFWGAQAIAVVVHFMIFAFWPEMTAADVSITTTEFESIELPPEVEIPPPPQPIARPATPVISDAVIDEDITIAPTTFEDNPIVENLPPPPPQQAPQDLAAAPTFTPMTVRPRLLNGDQITRLIERVYPPLLRDAGIGGRTVYWFFIDENGVPQNWQVQQSSGHPQLDNIMASIWQEFRFSPAMNRDQRVPVWIELPITYEAR